MNGGCYNHLCPNSTSYNTGYRAQDGVVSPLKRKVQAPVKICVKSDSLHNVQLGAGLPSLSRQIIEIDNTAINASNIHIVRLMICLSVFLVTRPLYDQADHLLQPRFPVSRARRPNDRLK